MVTRRASKQSVAVAHGGNFLWVPRDIVSWRSLQSDTSSDDDSSISSADERTAPTHASTVTEENERTVIVSVVQEDGFGLPIAEQDATSTKQHVEQDEHYSESLEDYRQSVATSMEAGSLWSNYFDEARNEESVVTVPKVPSSAESEFMESFPINVDEFFKQEGADTEKSHQAVDSPSDEGSLAWKEPWPQASDIRGLFKPNWGQSCRDRHHCL